MNFRPLLRFTPEGAVTCRIEATSAAADGKAVFGNLKIARGHLEIWIDRAIEDLRDARREWLTKAERKLPSEDGAGQGRQDSPADGGAT